METTDVVSTLSPIVAHRLRARDASDLVRAYAAAMLDVAIYTTYTSSDGDDLPPATIAEFRLVLLARLASRLRRVPSEAEVVALLRVPGSTARSMIKKVLAASDTAADVALTSVFRRATLTGHAGGKGKIPNGQLWHFKSLSDLVLAKQELEHVNKKFATQSDNDGNYVLVIDPNFDPGIK